MEERDPKCQDAASLKVNILFYWNSFCLSFRRYIGTKFPSLARGKMIHSTVKKKQKLIRSSKQRKIDKLRKIIPGCEEVDIELEMQVDILKTLSKLHGFDQNSSLTLNHFKHLL
ncbi:hypothetical protein AAG906_011373 [Vitis piasezkii]